MLISFDPEVKALYIQLKDNKVSRTVEFAPQTFVDLDSRGDLIGVEMLQPGTLTITIQVLKKISTQFNAPMLRRIPSDYIPKAFAHA